MRRAPIWGIAIVAAAWACGGDDDGGAGDAGRADRDGGGTASDAGGTDSGGDPGADGGGPGVDGGGGTVEPVPEEFRFCDAPGAGMVIDATPASYRDVLATLAPGDTMRLAAGTYDQGLTIADVHGTEGACIVIEGPATGERAVFLGSSSRNTISIRDSSYVVVKNLEVDGNGEIGDGVKAEGTAAFAHHIVIDGLYVHSQGGDQQIVGINTKCTTWRWVIRNNLIVDSGTGLYLGGSGGDVPFIGGLIEHNVVLDPIGYGMQIKHQLARPMLEGIPTNATTIIRHNVFSKANRATTASARPNLLLGHFPTSGAGSDDQYLVYGNFLHENPTEALFQAEGNVAFYDNVLINGAGPAIRIQPHNDVPKRIDVFHNTVVASGTGIRVAGGDPAFEQRVIGNAVFAGTPIDGGDARDNATFAHSDAGTYLAAPGAAVGAGLDLHPLPGQLEGAVDLGGISFLWSDHDFDGRLRGGTGHGAYIGPADAGAWMLARERKP